MTLADIREDLKGIRERWRSGTTPERQRDLVDLNDLVGEVDDLPAVSSSSVEELDQVRGRIEILIDEIEISVGIEPSPMTEYADSDRHT